ncbi:leucine-rich repeat protein [Prevotella communis]|uniref:leucine-rich repeat protein n=1 Tax=Prevotella communis TaxID=2913614 RepID=UPI001EDBD283|nr:leucine-rich repeat protein [Prevotella communis]UKK70451.1 leucine-rich repeat protein [Prevotella communis]
MKRHLLFILMMMLPIVTWANASGECGAKLTWTYTDTTKTLEIYGSGLMYNYEGAGLREAPWVNYPIEKIIIDSGVTSIGSYAFYKMKTVTSLSIPETLKKIEYNAFEGCSGLSSLTISNNNINIGNLAFYGCIGLNSLNFFNSKIVIGNSTFEGCSGLANLSISNCTISIGTRAFTGCKSLTSMELPSGVSSIGESAFLGCSGLYSIVIPNSVTNIGKSAFAHCSNLTKIKVDEDNMVYDSRNNCNAILITSNNTLIVGSKNTIIPNNTKTIGKSAFAGCVGITSIEIPNSVTDIEESAFAGCSDLISIKLSNGITEIKDNTFQGCTSLNHIEIPNSVIKIGKLAFWTCQNITSVIIPNSMTRICSCAFESCTGLKDVFCYATQLPIMENSVFGEVDIANATLHIPSKSINLYQTTSPWQEFGNIVPVPVHTLKYIVDDSIYKSIAIEEGSIIVPETAPSKVGYTFSGWDNVPETMPAYDIIVSGSFTVNKYLLTYMIDGEIIKSDSINYNEILQLETEPTKEGYTFSGWSEMPDTMPAHDVTVIGTFIINSYKLTYMIDDMVYKETTYEYGATIIPEPQPVGNYNTFEWIGLPQNMPAHDVVVYANYTTGIFEHIYDKNNKCMYSFIGRKLYQLRKGLNIISRKNGEIKKILKK